MTMIALIIAGALYPFGRQDNSSDDSSNDCFENVFNGYDSTRGRFCWRFGSMYGVGIFGLIMV